MHTAGVEHKHQEIDTPSSSHDEALGIERRGDKKIERLKTKEGGDSLGKAPQEHSPFTCEGESEDSRPSLEPSKFKDTLFDFDPGRDVPLIAIVGEALMLEMKATSDSWSSFFKEASEHMQMYMTLAPIAANAAEQSYVQMAEATEHEANIDSKLGMAQLGASVGAAAIGLKSGLSAVEKQTAQAEKLEIKNLTSRFPGAADGGLPSLRAAESQAAQNSGKWYTRAWDTVKNTTPYRFGSSAMKYIGTVGMKFSTASAGLNMAAQGTTQFFYTANQKSQMAENQKNQGYQQGLQKRGESYGQYEDQNFQRRDGFRQQAEQFYGQAIQLFNSICDSSSQSTRALFQG